jgi:hypothetical protein
MDKWTGNVSKEVQMTDKHTKKRSTPLAIKEMQIKPTLILHPTH